MAVRFIYENGEYYVVALNENGDFVRLNFGNSIDNSLMSATNFGNFNILSSTRGIETIWDNGTWHTFTANAVTNELFSIDFSKDCGISKGGSRLYEPNGISYNQSGTFTITFTGYNDLGGFSSLSKNINVTNSQAPQIAVEENESLCLSTVKTFSAISPDEATITSYQWTFGDNSPRSRPRSHPPIHQSRNIRSHPRSRIRQRLRQSPHQGNHHLRTARSRLHRARRASLYQRGRQLYQYHQYPGSR